MLITHIVIPFDVEQKLIWKHNLQAYEVYELFGNEPRIRFREKGKVRGEDVYTARGQTNAGRYLAVFFIYKPSSHTALVISARDMNSTERRSYGKK